MKKTLILLAMVASSSAFAQDSLWQLCQGEATLFDQKETILVNLYDHRDATGRGRITDLTFIFGGNVLSGSLDSTRNNSGKVTLKQGRSALSGTVVIDYTANTLSLKGTMSLLGAATPVESVLSCKTLRD